MFSTQYVRVLPTQTPASHVPTPRSVRGMCCSVQESRMGSYKTTKKAALKKPIPGIRVQLNVFVVSMVK